MRKLCDYWEVGFGKAKHIYKGIIIPPIILSMAPVESAFLGTGRVDSWPGEGQTQLNSFL